MSRKEHTSFHADGLLSESLLSSEASTNNEIKAKKVGRLSVYFGALVGLLVHLSTLGINVWLGTVVSSLLEHRVYWSFVSSFLISTLVVLIYVILSSLADQMQSPTALTTLALETRFVGGFLCSLVLCSTCYESALFQINGPSTPLMVLTGSSLIILLSGWLAISAYEKARMAEIISEEESEGLAF